MLGLFLLSDRELPVYIVNIICTEKKDAVLNKNYLLKIKSLIIFRNITEDDIFEKFIELLSVNEKDKLALASAYCEFLSALLKKSESFSGYLKDIITNNENIFTDFCVSGKGDEAFLKNQLKKELMLFTEISDFDGSEIKKLVPEANLPLIPSNKTDFESIYQDCIKNMHTKGFGIFSKHRMFILDGDGNIVPILHPDTQRLDELYGYESEKNKIIANTLAFLGGKPANNVLLYGDAGTGKSSTIKATVNEFFDRGLRLIELKKTQLYLIQGLMDRLAHNPLKFILFIDDLTFASDDKDFCALKAILEGSVNSRGDNMLIYVTSNHRHLFKEIAGDREGDEISVNDKIQEIISLSARFGLKITFTKPDKLLYEKIVTELADKAGIKMNRKLLISKAEAFAIRNDGRNPRAAKQFIDSLSVDTFNTR